jgi:cytochrome b pre-mRNA-processing protein 3
MTLLARLFGSRRNAAALRPLYDLVVACGRDPAWYRDGGVPDTLDGRFDMVAAILSLVLLRLEREGEAARREAVVLTEIFIEDMDASLRQIGIGDFVVGKHIGRMMGALGGRLGAFRDAGDAEAQVEAVRRNIFRDAPPSEAKLAWVAERLRGIEAKLAATPLATLLEGRFA